VVGKREEEERGDREREPEDTLSYNRS